MGDIGLMRFRIALVVLLLIVAFVLGGNCAERFWIRDAVKHGAAEWEVHEDGSTTFRWKGEGVPNAE